MQPLLHLRTTSRQRSMHRKHQENTEAQTKGGAGMLRRDSDSKAQQVQPKFKEHDLRFG